MLKSGKTSSASYRNWCAKLDLKLDRQLEPITTPALIIGAGPVGLFQAFQLGLLEIPCHLVDALPHPGGQCAELYPGKPIYDIPGTPVTTGRELVVSLLAQLKPFTGNGSAQLHWQQLVSAVQKLDDGRFQVDTSSGQRFVATTLFIAAGAGAFVPRKLKVPGLELLEGRQLHYQLPGGFNPVGEHLVVQGDDDTALDWAIALAEPESPGQAAAQVTLLHRRDAFTATSERVARMRALCSAGRMQFIAGQIVGHGDGHADGATANDAADPPTLATLTLALPDGSQQTLRADHLFAALGMSPQMGPLANWGLELQRKQVPVDTERFQTRIPGIFAVGDINTYPGKKKLILCGFHETVLAAFAAAEIVYPGKPQPLQYTTTSTKLHALLGVVAATPSA